MIGLACISGQMMTRRDIFLPLSTETSNIERKVYPSFKIEFVHIEPKTCTKGVKLNKVKNCFFTEVVC